VLELSGSKLLGYHLLHAAASQRLAWPGIVLPKRCSGTAHRHLLCLRGALIKHHEVLTAWCGWRVVAAAGVKARTVDRKEAGP
jgi:hypothetical protein